MRILIIGLSTRAIAESAVKGNYQVVTVDYFGDRDQKDLVENYALQRDLHLPFKAQSLLKAGHTLDFEALVYISNLENQPYVVEELSGGRHLLGNTAQTLRQVRHWPTLRAFCQGQGISFAPTLFAGEEKQVDEPRRWLRKPLRSGGGHGITFWPEGRLDANHCLQAYIEGQPCSAAFVSDGQESVLIGLTEQLIGREELGARGFAWAGNILPLSLPQSELDAVLNTLQLMVGQLTRRFGLRGVNGVDFVLAREKDGRPHPFLVEVNPRYTASMELVEWAYGLNVFGLHVCACRGELPSFRLQENIHRTDFYGKGIVYARKDTVLPETSEWKQRGRRDIPFPGERIEAGHPICTVLASGKNYDECWSHLLMNTDLIRQEVE